MENQPKLNSSKEVIAYLAKQFPLCFVAEGEAKPLKIGIFQDLVVRLANETCISKTQLRTALRLYTTSWRYLYGIKLGAERVDLDGNSCGVLDQQHVEHAKKQLEEAKARIQEKRAKVRAEAAANERSLKPKHHGVKKGESPAKMDRGVAFDKKVENNTHRPTKVKTDVTSLSSVKPDVLLDISSLKTGQSIKVKVGRSVMDATILEVVKDGARVQLVSGLAMIVRSEHLNL